MQLRFMLYGSCNHRITQCHRDGLSHGTARAHRLVTRCDTDVVINLTSGMGGEWVPGESDPALPGPGTDMIGPEDRLAHVIDCKPEICSLDCGTMNFGNGNEIYISTPPFLRKMASITQQIGVKPELEVFELGHIRFAKQMIAEGIIDAPPLFQICVYTYQTSFAVIQHLIKLAVFSEFLR